MIAALALVGAAVASPMPLALESVVLEDVSASTRLTSGELLRRLEDRLKPSLPSLVVRPPSAFDLQSPETPLRFGVRVSDAECLSFESDTVRCKVQTEWLLYHQPTNAIVYRITIPGFGVGPNVTEAFVWALFETGGKLVGSAAFKERLEPSFYPPQLDEKALRSCHEPDTAGAALETGRPSVWALGLDERGSVLVGGAPEGPLRIRPAGGPWLDAERIASQGELALVHIPVLDGLPCAADTRPLPRPVGEIADVGAALQALGQTRAAPRAGPGVLTDVLRGANEGTYNFDEDEGE